MPLLDIHHVAIKTQDLEATDRFYTDVLGLEKIDRPDFDFPGSWFDLGSTMIHIMAGNAGLDNEGNPTHGSASVDHVAVKAHDYDAMKQSVIDHAMPHREFAIPDFGLWQLFVRDPNGVIIELNFTVDDEPSANKGPGTDNLFVPGEF